MRWPGRSFLIAAATTILLTPGNVAAQSCYFISNADIALSRRTIANGCARGAQDCYGEARRWQNVVRNSGNRLCPDTDRGAFQEHNAMVREIIARYGRDRGIVSRHNRAVEEFNRPRGYSGGYTPPPVPSNPNPLSLYGYQPSYAPCTRYDLHSDGSKFCY